jgi:cobalamin biosynthesis Mg chelatase CobN
MSLTVIFICVDGNGPYKQDGNDAAAAAADVFVCDVGGNDKCDAGCVICSVLSGCLFVLQSVFQRYFSLRSDNLHVPHHHRYQYHNN